MFIKGGDKKTLWQETGSANGSFPRNSNPVTDNVARYN